MRALSATSGARAREWCSDVGQMGAVPPQDLRRILTLVSMTQKLTSLAARATPGSGHNDAGAARHVLRGSRVHTCVSRLVAGASSFSPRSFY